MFYFKNLVRLIFGILDFCFFLFCFSKFVFQTLEESWKNGCKCVIFFCTTKKRKRKIVSQIVVHLRHFSTTGVSLKNFLSNFIASGLFLPDPYFVFFRFFFFGALVVSFVLVSLWEKKGFERFLVIFTLFCFCFKWKFSGFCGIRISPLAIFIFKFFFSLMDHRRSLGVSSLKTSPNVFPSSRWLFLFCFFSVVSLTELLALQSQFFPS